jgi:hypothetical protein
MPTKQKDILIRNCGTVWQFVPLSRRAKKWISENVQSEPWQHMGSTLVVDWRYGQPLAEGMAEAGLKV